jgi:hypothetical protein
MRERWTCLSLCQLSSHQSTPTQHDLASAHRLLNYVSSHRNPSSMALWACTDASFLSRLKSGSVAGCSVALGDSPPYLLNPPPESHRQSWKDKQSLVRASRLLQSHPSHVTPLSVTHNAPLHAFCQRIPVVVASVTEAEYAAAFGGGQVLVELTLTLTNLGHPQQSPPLLFVDNECAIGLATSSVRPKKSKSIDMRLDWIKERAGQNFFCLVFLSGLINPADFFTKILPVYRHITALPFLHGTPYHPQPPHPFRHPPLPHHTPSPQPFMSSRQGPTYLSLPLTPPHLYFTNPRSPCQHVTLLTSLRCTPVLLPHRYAGIPTHLTTPAPPPDIGFKPFRVLHYS